MNVDTVLSQENKQLSCNKNNNQQQKKTLTNQCVDQASRRSYLKQIQKKHYIHFSFVLYKEASKQAWVEIVASKLHTFTPVKLPI